MSEPKNPAFGTEQERTSWAWKQIDEVVTQERDKSVQDRYGTLARKLPSYLQVNGAGQTLAFLYSKGKGEGARGGSGRVGSGNAYLLRHLRDRVLRTIRGPNLSGSNEDIMQVFVSLDPEAHRMVSAELAATATWLKRFAEGRLEEEPDEGAGGPT